MDSDNDGIADGCDTCPNDADKDDVCDDVDQCPGFDDKVDADNDGIADGCDTCPKDADNDADKDGVCDDFDLCPGYNNLSDADCDGLLNNDEINIYGTEPENSDTDGDGIADGDEAAYWGSDWDAHFDDDDLINLLDPDADGDGYTDGEELALGFDPANALSKPGVLIEAGEIEVDHKWVHVSFKNMFIDPIVVAKPASFNDSEPCTIRIRNVDANGFQIRIQEWDYLDGNHSFETVGYIAVERGSYTLQDGSLLEAGSFSTKRKRSINTKSFARSFNRKPVVLASVVSNREADAVTGRLRNISATEFQFKLQEQQRNRQRHASETISYIAWEPSAGIVNGLTYEVVLTDDIMTHAWTTIDFRKSISTYPIFLADMQSTDSADTASLRYDYKDTLTVDLMVEEERSKDKEVKHTDETVGYILIVD